jgi:hypothetical protein
MSKADKLLNQYRQRFGVELLHHPPLDYGHIPMNDEDLARHARRALEAGRPVDWGEFFVPLPPDCES